MKNRWIIALALLAWLACSSASTEPETESEGPPDFAGNTDSALDGDRAGLGGSTEDPGSPGAGSGGAPGASGSGATPSSMEAMGGALGLAGASASSMEGMGGTLGLAGMMDGPGMPADPGMAGAGTGGEDVTLSWIGTWASGPQLTEPNNNPPAPGLAGNTLRQKVFATLSGSRSRFLFSNEFGNGPVTFNAVRVARAGAASAIEPSTDRPLSFAGNASVTIPAGQAQFSDPVEFQIDALSQVAITIQFGNVPSGITGHPGSRTTSYIMPGDALSAASMPTAVTTDHWYYITAIDVEVAPPSAAVVTLGDSITDGRGSTTNANDRWPDQLARRLKANAATAPVSVLNLGIGGNAVVSGGLGPTAVARFQRDVLEQRGVRWVIVLEGINDIGGANDAGVADRLINAYDDFIDAAHARGLLVYGVPILPFAGNAGYDTPLRQTARQTVNNWIRTSGRFDAVIDLDAAVRDPANANRLLPAYDSGDGLHLSPAGYQAMANAINLALLTP